MTPLDVRFCQISSRSLCTLHAVVNNGREKYRRETWAVMITLFSADIRQCARTISFHERVVPPVSEFLELSRMLAVIGRPEVLCGLPRKSGSGRHSFSVHLLRGTSGKMTVETYDWRLLAIRYQCSIVILYFAVGQNDLKRFAEDVDVVVPNSRGFGL
jgi:hypothetical protein